MKTKLFFLLVLVFTLTGQIVAQLPEQDSLKFLWQETIDGPHSEMPNNIVANKDNHLFVMSNFGTYEKTESVEYRGFKCFGAKKDKIYSNAQTNNMVLYKIDQKGNLLWAVNTSIGDYGNQQSVVIPSNDGGALLVLKVRHTAYRDLTMYKDTLARVVDTKGDTCLFHLVRQPGERVYRPILIKLDENGVFEWTSMERTYDQPRMIGGKSRDRTDCFSFMDGTIDEEGNYYITGIIRDTLYWSTKEGGIQKIVPCDNVKDWNGSIQALSQRSDLIVLKIDAQGKYVWHLNTAGEAIEVAYGKALAYEDGALYMAAYLLGVAEKKTISLGDKSIDVIHKEDLIFAKITAETGVVQWLKQIKNANPGLKGYDRKKIEGISLGNGKIIASGSIKGGIVLNPGDTLRYRPDSLTNGSQSLRCFIIKLDAATGDVEAGAIDHSNQKGISEIQDAYFIKDKIYGMGYRNMTKQPTRFMYVYDENLNLLADYPLHTGGDQAVSKSATFINDQLYFLTRARTQTNKDFVKTYGTSDSISTKIWATMISSFKIPDIPASVPMIKQAADGLRVYTAKAQVIIDAEKLTPVTIYSISGQIVMRFIAAPGRTVKSLAPGLYIVNNQKVIVL